MTTDQLPDSHPPRLAPLVGGAILLTLGGAMLLDRTLPQRLGELTAPFVLIVLGVGMIFGRPGAVYGGRFARVDRPGYRVRRTRRSSTSGLWLIGIGAWMIVSEAHMFSLSFDTSWPLLVVLGGVLMVIRGLE